MTLDWHTILAIDHDAKACEVYRANIGAERVECGNVSDLIDTMPIADVILGGPPCQPYSSAGKQHGASDARDCVPDFCAAVEKVRPRMFLMEEVDAFAEQQKFQPVLQRTFKRLTDAGYDVQLRVLDAVDFGVPQFRRRAWLWGVRKDLGEVIARRKWPTPTHCDPALLAQGSMFGCDLKPWVTVGEALGLEGYIKRPRQTGAREVVSVGEPSCSLSATRTDEHYAIRRARAASVERRDHGADEPCPTITDGSNGSGGVLRLLLQSHADPARTIHAPAPAPALRSGGDGHDGCCVRIHEYRWSDAMREKHPPASPASPAPTVQAKWYKGGAEGLLSVDGRTWESRHPTPTPAEPMVTLCGRSPRDGGRCTQSVINDGLKVRRLTPDECAKLQSMPDDFVWPESVKKTHRYRIIGNGWASLMAKRMSEAFKAADPDSRTVIDLFCGGGCGAVGWHGRAWEYTPEEARAEA